MASCPRDCSPSGVEKHLLGLLGPTVQHVQFPNRPLTATDSSRLHGKLKVYGRCDQSDRRGDNFRPSSCRYAEAAEIAVDNSSNKEQSEQVNGKTDAAQFPNRPLTATEASRLHGKLKVYGRCDQPDGPAGKLRPSSCRYNQAAEIAVVQNVDKIASFSRDLSEQVNARKDSAQFPNRPLTATEASRLHGKLKVYGRCDTPAGKFRYNEAALVAVIQQHSLSSLGMGCSLPFSCSDDDPFVYVFVEALQLLKDWLSEDQHFANLLQLAYWDKRENVAGLLRSFGAEIREYSSTAVSRDILHDVLLCHRPSQQASVLLDSMLHSEIEATVVRLLEGGFELLASRFDDHVLEARAATGRDVLKCIFHILSRVIDDYSYFVDVLSTAIDIGHESTIRYVLPKAVICRRRRRGRETSDICQNLFKAAVRSGNSELVRSLLQLPQLCRYVNVNSVLDVTTGDTALHLACRMGSTLINQTFDGHLCSKAAYLLFRKSKDSHAEETALSLACRTNYYRFMAAAAATDAYPRNVLDVWRLLAMSSQMQKLQLNVHFDDYVELTHLLILHGADMYATNRKGETALHVAASLQLHGNVLLEIYALRRTYVFERDLRWKQNCTLFGILKTLQEKNLQENEVEWFFTCIVSKLFSPNVIKLLNAVVHSYFNNVTRLIRTLLQAGMDVNWRTAAGDTAVMVAADEASRCIVFCRQMCTTAAYQVHERAEAVEEFLRANIFTVVKELLICNADCRVGRSNGVGLLDIALCSNQTDLLVELICQGAAPVSWPEYLVLVFESESQSVAKTTMTTLSTIGITVDIRNEIGQTALHIAAERDRIDVLRDLIHAGADTRAVDDAGRSPLETALGRGCSNAAVTLQMLLPGSHSARFINTLNSVGQTALHVAAKEDNVEEVFRLLSRGADVRILDDDGRSPLVTALVYRSWNAARAILDHGPDVVASSRMDVVIDSEGSTWLHHHPAFRHVRGEMPTPLDILRRILDSGISPDIRDFNGNTPLHNVPLRYELIQLLVEYRADVNAQNVCGQTPLHVAFRAGNVEVVRCLLQCGADVNARDDFYNTPFHCDTSYYSRWKLLIPDLPQSIVRSDALNVFGTRSVFHRMALPFHEKSDDLRQRSTPINTSYRDYIGNTALHVAARVYSEYNSFSVIHLDDDKQEDMFSLKSEADFSVMNNFGHTPLHLRWLYSGFELERDEFLHQRDGRGRTSWHYMFIFDHVFHAWTYIYDCCNLTEVDIHKELEVLHMFPEAPAGFQSKRCFLNIAGCNEADDLGRTPLHYAAMQSMFCHRCYVDGCYLYCKCCIFLFGIDSWSVRDKWGRIPLHYAYLKGFELPQFQTDMLPLELTDVDGVALQDIDGYTPKQMLGSHMQDRLSRQRSRDFESSCFADFKKLLQHCSTEDFFQECVGGEIVDEQLKQMWPEKDATAFVWNIWTQLQYAYRDPDYVIVCAAVHDFMSRLVVAIGEEDHRLEGRLHDVGSSFEGTRIGFPDEFDFNIELVKLNSICDVVTLSECPNGFAYLIKKPGVNLEDGGYDQFFDSSGTLMATAVSFWFQFTWIKVLSWQKFWDTEPLFEITGLPQMYIQAPNKLVKNITLRFNRSIGGKILHYDISIDIVPVVRVEGWWPRGTRKVSSDIRAAGCNFVFDQPRHKHGAAHSKKSYVRISFARAESMFIGVSPPVVRAAYMVAKQITSQHLDEVTDPKISSHTLKMAVLWSVEETNPAEEDDILSEHSYSELEPHQLQRQVEALFRRLWNFSVQDFVPSFFMPSVRVAVWSFEKFPKYSHTFLRRTYSNYEKLFGSRVEPSKDSELSNIRQTRRNVRSALAYSFALFYAVSSHNSWSTDWLFPIITDNN